MFRVQAETVLPPAGGLRKRPSVSTVNMPEPEAQIVALMAHLMHVLIDTANWETIFEWSSAPQSLTLRLPQGTEARSDVAVPVHGALLRRARAYICKGPLIGFEFKKPSARGSHKYTKALAQCVCQIIAIVQQRLSRQGRRVLHQHWSTVYQVLICSRCRAQLVFVKFPELYLEKLEKSETLPQLSLHMSPVFDLTSKAGLMQFISLLFLAAEQLQHEITKENRRI